MSCGLKGGNRHFFVGRLITAVRQSLKDWAGEAACPAIAIVIELEEGAAVEPVIDRLERFSRGVFCGGARNSAEKMQQSQRQRNGAEQDVEAKKVEQARAISEISAAAWKKLSR